MAYWNLLGPIICLDSNIWPHLNAYLEHQQKKKSENISKVKKKDNKNLAEGS